MTPHMKWAIAGIVVGLLLFIVAPWYVPVAIIALSIAVPVGFWMALGPVNRRRIRGMRSRGQLP